MKKSLSKVLVGVTLALGVFSVGSVANAYNYQNCRWVPASVGPYGHWMAGHRECVNATYSVDRCGWVPGHFASYGWVPGHRACWW